MILENNNANGISAEEMTIPPEDMAIKAEYFGVSKVSKPLWQSFYLAITAGVFIAIYLACPAVSC
ncbi:MAG: hypothetical protein JKY50_03250 [Oleispira sp.]|nr:hypothetical protein [Oleispira sp.]MBL4881633.1 hypothetical protein [Oleispira sp.]